MDKEKSTDRPPPRNTQPIQLTSDEAASRSVSPTSSSLVQSTSLGLILANTVQRGTSNVPSIRERYVSTNPNSPGSVRSSQMTRRNAIMSYRKNDRIHREFTGSSSPPQTGACATSGSGPISYRHAKSYSKVANFDYAIKSKNYEEKYPRPPSPTTYPCSENFKCSSRHLSGENPTRISSRACNEDVPADDLAEFCPDYMRALTDMQFRIEKMTNRRQTFQTDSSSFSANEGSLSTPLSDVTNEVNDHYLTTLMSETSEVTTQLKSMQDKLP